MRHQPSSPHQHPSRYVVARLPIDEQQDDGQGEAGIFKQIHPAGDREEDQVGRVRNGRLDLRVHLLLLQLLFDRG